MDHEYLYLVIYFVGAWNVFVGWSTI